MVALDRSTGEEVWRTGEDSVQGNLVSGPVVADGMILVFEPGSVIALDAAEGRFLWRSEIVNPHDALLPQGISTLGPVSDDGTVYAVDVTGRARAGRRDGDRALGPRAERSIPATPPVLTDAHLVVPTNSGSLYAIDRRTGHLAFRIDAGAAFLRGLADAGDVLVAVAGVEDVEIVAFGADADGVLTDEPSPTTFDLGELLAGFALGALPVAIVALAPRVAVAAAPRSHAAARLGSRSSGGDEMSSGTRGTRGRPAPARRGGMLSRMSVPPMDSMPPIRTAFVRGLAATWSSPVVVGATVAWLRTEWLVVVALGYPGPFALLAHIVAPAPLSTTTDLSVSIGILGVSKGLPLVLIPALVHALWHAIVVGLAVEAVETGRASRWGAIRGLRALPVAFAIHAFGVAVLFTSQIVAGLVAGLSFVQQLDPRPRGSGCSRSHP